jgi:hypothetical protein
MEGERMEVANELEFYVFFRSRCSRYREMFLNSIAVKVLVLRYKEIENDTDL